MEGRKDETDNSVESQFALRLHVPPNAKTAPQPDSAGMSGSSARPSLRPWECPTTSQKGRRKTVRDRVQLRKEEEEVQEGRKTGV